MTSRFAVLFGASVLAMGCAAARADAVGKSHAAATTGPGADAALALCASLPNDDQ
jgi:hypothetical protein